MPLYVKDFGAVGDGATDDTAALQRAADAATSGGEIIYENKAYKVSGPIITTASGVTHRGEGVYGTKIIQISPCSETFSFVGAHHSGVENLLIQQTTPATSGYAIKFNRSSAYSCFYGFVKNVRIQDTFNGIDIKCSTETRIHTVHMRGLKGVRGINISGENKTNWGSFRAIIEDVVGDTAGNGNTAIVWFAQDSYAYSLVLDKCVALNGGIGFSMLDFVNSGDSFPIWCYPTDLECDHNQLCGINLAAGEGFYMTQSWIGSVVAGSGINIGSGFRGEVNMGNSRIVGNAQHGIVLNAGPVDTMIHDCVIGDNSASGAGACHGVVMAPNASRFSILDNKIGDVVASAGNNQGFGVFIMAGASTDYNISNNNLKGNRSGALLNASTVPGIVAGNLV